MSVFFAHAQNTPKSAINIIPRPAQTELRLGSFTLSAQTLICASRHDSAAWKTAILWQEELQLSLGLTLKMQNLDLARPAANFVIFNTQQGMQYGTEGYTIEISPTSIALEAEGSAGIFYAFQSLRQLIPAEFLQAVPVAKTPATQSLHVTFQAMFIRDNPAFTWRGMHLDVSRHFFGKEVIKRYLDYMAFLKMNIFHWHLTDSQGWRIEIKKYPRLTSVGAHRVQRNGERFYEALPAKPGEQLNYGGFYTQGEVKEIIAYAAERHITIVPEIDMPGHCMAALVAYPEFATIKGQIAMPSGRVNAYINTFNPGNDSTYLFLDNILAEVISLFPSPYIHVGGDEVDRSTWAQNPQCREMMKRENLRNVDELQSYFTRRIERMISSRGRKMIGWDEILDGGLAPEAVVMSWRGYKGGVVAARERHEVVMAPKPYAYLDLYQGDPKLEPETYSRNTLSTSYLFDPLPAGLPADDRRFILGGHGALWTENVPDVPHLEHMLFPRLFAVAECEWTSVYRKNFEDFLLRVDYHLRRLSLAKVNYAKSAWNVWLRPARDTSGGNVLIACSNEVGQGRIFYTRDGTVPDAKAILYSVPFVVSGKQTIRAAAFNSKGILSEVNTENFVTTKTTGCALELRPVPASRFAGYNSFTLCDGILGTENPFDGRWQGFTAAQLNATIDLKKLTFIENIGINFLEEPGLSMYLPLDLDIQLSDDGRNFISLLHYDEKDIRSMKTGNHVRIYREFKPVSVRYLRFIARNRNAGPDDNGKTYLMVDELSAN